MQTFEEGHNTAGDSRVRASEYSWELPQRNAPDTPSVTRSNPTSSTLRKTAHTPLESSAGLRLFLESADTTRVAPRLREDIPHEHATTAAVYTSRPFDSRSKSMLGTPINIPRTSTANLASPDPEARYPSPAESELIKKENNSGYVSMAHCQLKGPLHGPLRERRRGDLSKNHPIWEVTRDIQAEVMATTQQIRRTPGLPASLSSLICDTLTRHAQFFNNAIREIVDDASEIRIQIEEANHALMNLKVKEGTAYHELAKMEKQTQDQISRAEDTENRLAKYHADAEKDRNEVREHIAKLKDEEDTSAKEHIIKELLQTLEKQLEVRHTIWVEPEVKPSEYEQALATVKENNPGLIPEEPSEEDRPQFPPMNPFDAGKYDVPKRSTSLGSPVAVRLRGGLGGAAGHGNFPPGGPYRMQQLPPHHINGDDAATEMYRPMTPQNHVEPGARLTMANSGISGLPGRPASSMGQQGFHPNLSNIHNDNSLSAKAPEFFPLGWAYRDESHVREDPNAFVDQMANISLGSGPGRGRGLPGAGSYIDNPGQGRFPVGAGIRPMSSGGNARAVVPYVSNDARVNAGLMDPPIYGQGPPPHRPQFGPNQYDNRMVVPRTQPVITLGQAYGGISDDLGRFSIAFRDLFGMTRGVVANWIVQDGSQVNRNAGVMQCLPRCYTGFTEQQAWSYIRQHLQDDLSRSCLFARVVVDFICERIMVPSAWQGFDYQTDRRIQKVEEEKKIGHIVTSNGRAAYTNTVVDILNVIISSERYEAYREDRIQYFARELEAMLGPLMNQYSNLGEAFKDLRSLVGKAWSLSAKTLTSRMAFEYRFPEAGCRFSMQSMIAVAPNIDGYQLQAEHWRVQLVVTPVITVRSDNGNTLSVDVTNLAEVLLMK